MKLLGATGSHVGNVREANQDRVYFRGLVAALADGMGGHQGGERAAELAITEFEEAGQDLSEGDLVEVVLQANRQVHGHAADNGLPGMGTTVVAMTLHEDDTITVANVGDSRAYWLRGDYMGQVTEDHSFVEDLVRQGRLTAEEAATHPQRNILTRAVGIGAEVEVDRFPIPEPEVGDRFLLCSDGLFNELSEDEILDILLDAGDPTQTAAALIEATLRTPCRDNVTVAVVDLVADDDPRVAVQAADEQSSKVITAPIPVVSKSVLHDPKPVDRGNGAADSSAATGQSQTGTLLLAEAEKQTTDDDPELYLDTAELNIVDDLEPTSVQPRSHLAMGIGVVVLLAALAAGGFFLARNYAKSGVFIADDASGQLAIFEGRRGGFLGFDPVQVIGTDFSFQTLDSTQQAMVGQDFETLEDAEAVVAQIADELAAVQSLESSDGNSQDGDDQPGDGSQIGRSSETDQQTSTTQLNQPPQSASTTES